MIDASRKLWSKVEEGLKDRQPVRVGPMHKVTMQARC